MSNKYWFVEYMVVPDMVWQRTKKFDSKDEAIVFARDENKKHDGGNAVHCVFEVPGFKEIYKRGYISPRCAKCGCLITDTMDEWVPYNCFDCVMSARKDKKL